MLVNRLKRRHHLSKCAVGQWNQDQFEKPWAVYIDLKKVEFVNMLPANCGSLRYLRLLLNFVYFSRSVLYLLMKIRIGLFSCI